MGVDVYVFRFLLEFRGRLAGDALCLGRQGFHIAPGTAAWTQAEALLDATDPGRSLETLQSPGGYTENLFAYLGASSLRSLDYSAYEGCEVAHDLNEPVPGELEGRFDVVFDGGTLEHVYNVPVAVANVKRMLRPGGLFIGVSPANNQLGHGLYQFSPDFFWQTYSEEAGFRIEKMQLVPLSQDPPVDLAHLPGVRQEIGTTPHSTYIMVAARRAADAALKIGNAYQTDYAAVWQQASG